MYCPKCLHQDTRVLESRTISEGRSIRRRRSCSQCEYRFTTYEKLENLNVKIQKKDQRFEAYNREKLQRAINIACQKRPITPDQIDQVISKIERSLQNLGSKSIPSNTIGDLLMEELKVLDRIAYVRFASVYKDFKDPEHFLQEIKGLLHKKNDPRSPLN